MASRDIVIPRWFKDHSLTKFFQEIEKQEGIALCIELLEIMQKEKEKQNKTLLDSLFAQYLVSVLQRNYDSGKALFALFEKYKLKVKPICKVWFQQCIQHSNLEGLKWIVSSYPKDFDYNKPVFAIATLRNCAPNPASLYYCQILKESDIISATFLKEPENFEEMSKYHSLAPEFRQVFQIKEEHSIIDDLIQMPKTSPDEALLPVKKEKNRSKI